MIVAPEATPMNDAPSRRPRPERATQGWKGEPPGTKRPVEKNMVKKNMGMSQAEVCQQDATCHSVNKPLPKESMLQSGFNKTMAPCKNWQCTSPYFTYHPDGSPDDLDG